MCVCVCVYTCGYIHMYDYVCVCMHVSDCMYE